MSSFSLLGLGEVLEETVLDSEAFLLLSADDGRALLRGDAGGGAYIAESSDASTNVVDSPVKDMVFGLSLSLSLGCWVSARVYGGGSRNVCAGPLLCSALHCEFSVRSCSGGSFCLGQSCRLLHIHMAQPFMRGSFAFAEMEVYSVEQCAAGGDLQMPL